MTYRIDELAASDWPDVAEIYKAGIATGNATFETRVPSWPEWDAAHFAVCRLACRRAAGLHGRGLGLALLQALVIASEAHGIWTLQASTFPENGASMAIQERCGFRVVGRRDRIAQLAGVWRDTILTERRSHRVGT